MLAGEVLGAVIIPPFSDRQHRRKPYILLGLLLAIPGLIGLTFARSSWTNDDYFGGKTLEQDPLYTAQLHVTYNFGRGVWAALSGTYDYGGRTTVDGVENDDSASNSRMGATLALPVNRNNSVKPSTRAAALLPGRGAISRCTGLSGSTAGDRGALAA